MRKITVKFNSSSRVQKLKKIMKEVYASSANDGTKLVKFNLKKTFIPAKVEEIEIEINKVIGGSVKLIIPKHSLTFLSTEPPFDLVDRACMIEGYYVVLPWNIATASGRNDLKSLINKISTSTTSLRYTVSLNTDEGASGLDTISQAELSLSDNSFEDNTDELFNKIIELENRIRLLDQNLTNSNSELVQKDTKITALNTLTARVTNDLNRYIKLSNANNSGIQNYSTKERDALHEVCLLKNEISTLQQQVRSLSDPSSDNGKVVYIGPYYIRKNGQVIAGGTHCYEYQRYSGTVYSDVLLTHSERHTF